MVAPDLSLAGDACLLHIGPHKTGTTTLQGAFHLARAALLDHGVVYAGPDRQPMRAALAVTNRPELVGQRAPAISDWTALTEQVAAAADRRVVVSSEFFADADDAAVQRVVDELGGPRVHVVVTLRPLVRILSSQWQQYVQNGMRTRYESWLRSMFEKPPYREPTPSFWRRHRHDRLVERWADAAGGRLTVVVADESDPLMLVRTFERLLALPEGILVPEAELTNRSLTAGEAEFARLLNEEFRKRAWPNELYQKLFRAGAVVRMKAAHEPTKDEPRIVTPQWAVEKAVALNAEMVEKIQTLGVRVIGDTDSLCRVPAARGPASAGPPMMSPESALQAVLGALLAAGAVPDPEHPQRPEDRPVRETTARALAGILAARVRRRVQRTLRR